MSDTTQQYDGRLYTQAEVDRLVREARINEHAIIKDRIRLREFNQSGMDAMDERLAELSKEEV